jgi:hypothetical protein
MHMPIITHPVNHGVGEDDEPHIPGPGFELARRLGASHTASWILTSNAYPDLPKLSNTQAHLTSTGEFTYEKPPSRHDIKHADRVTMIVRAGREGSEDEEDDSREHQRVGA